MELTTARLLLAPLDPGRDAQMLHAAYSDADVMRWWHTPLRVDVADTRRDLTEGLERAGAHLWVVRETEKPVGLVGLLGDVAVPGLTWLLCRPAWGRGLMTEAAGAVIEYAFGPLGLARVEAWVDAANVRSLSTARRVGLTECGRLAQRYPHRNQPHETIVLGRSRGQEPTAVLSVEVTLPVRDVAAEFELLRTVLGGRTLYGVGDPPTLVGVVFGAWSVGPCVRLVATASPIAPVTVNVDVGTQFDSSYRRAVAAGGDIAAPPVEQPWGMREFVLRLCDGHQLVVTGPA
ncbi:MAG: GNAT family N-acetyltransferase [Mycobacterium sp.]|uniref:GNAT family N-acetyltransferase n=1 Tax=Mycobacterium sp. TaxID=1785 RepID=UPI00389B047D